ncbi:MAG TPA: substrate-binding domain-containing protein [Gemmatimonadales bacterium]|nr:substrate-binding domain-containing protein [Gemmatimonadales bacterium]
MSLRRVALALLTAIGACRADGRSTRAGQGKPGSPATGGSIILATTTSTQDSGLLDSLVPLFTAATGIDVKVIAVGSGAALELGRRGDADVVLSHAPDAERGYVASGDLIERRLVMHNDFLVVGPAADPARAEGHPLREGLALIARTGPVISRADGSGTDKKELALWHQGGIDPARVAGREMTGQGMGATLQVAEQRQGYALTDRATYLALRPRLTLVPVLSGDPGLMNVYHVYVVNPARHSRVHLAEARAFVDFLVGAGAQELIGAFGRARYGEPLFVADAGKADPTGN